MSVQAIEALRVDVHDLTATLHLLSDAAERRGDEDSRGALRLLVRHAEAIEERIERMSEQ